MMVVRSTNQRLAWLQTRGVDVSLVIMLGTVRLGTNEELGRK
jgi:hypothetical protein